MRKRLDKFEAAELQLATGIRLLISGGCPVSATTLIGAGGEILRECCDKFAGGFPASGTLQCSPVGTFVSEKSLIKAHSRLQAYLKHARTDANAVCSYDWELTLDYAEYLSRVHLWICIRLGRPSIFEMHAYSWWWAFYSLRDDKDWAGAPPVVQDLRAYVNAKPFSGRDLFWQAVCTACDTGQVEIILPDNLVHSYEAEGPSASGCPRLPLIRVRGVPSIVSDSLKWERSARPLIPKAK